MESNLTNPPRVSVFRPWSTVDRINLRIEQEILDIAQVALTQ